MKSSEVNQFIVRTSKFSFNRSVELKQCTDCSQRFYFNSSELKKGSERRQRLPLIGVMENSIVSVFTDFILVIVTN